MTARLLKPIALPVLTTLIVLAALIGLARADAYRAILETDTGPHTFTVLIADTAEERAKGLMFWEELGPEEGMLFDYHEERHTSFWMKNTLIPLDMIFIAADGTVRKVHANAIPGDLNTIPSDVPVRFVLEIPGGRAAEIGLKPGDRLIHPRVAVP